MAKLEEVTDATFAQALERDGAIVAVDFWAPWCGPCRITTPILESLSEEYRGRVRVLALDTDLNPATTARLGVRGMPTLVFFRDAVELARVVGALPKAMLQRRFEEVLAGAAVR